jgi:ABC-type glycerol-3-phosphate transport system permease component
MKLSFLLSVAVGIAGVVMITVLWSILSSMGVFADMNRTVEGLLNTTNTSNGTKFDLMDYIGLGRVVSLSIVVAVIDVILMTAIATLGAFLYNVCSSLVGGLQITLTDD